MFIILYMFWFIRPSTGVCQTKQQLLFIIYIHYLKFLKEGYLITFHTIKKLQETRYTTATPSSRVQE